MKNKKITFIPDTLFYSIGRKWISGTLFLGGNAIGKTDAGFSLFTTAEISTIQTIITNVVKRKNKELNDISNKKSD